MDEEKIKNIGVSLGFIILVITFIIAIPNRNPEVGLLIFISGLAIFVAIYIFFKSLDQFYYVIIGGILLIVLGVSAYTALSGQSLAVIGIPFIISGIFLIIGGVGLFYIKNMLDLQERVPKTKGDWRKEESGVKDWRKENTKE